MKKLKSKSTLTAVIPLRFDKGLYQQMQDIANLESITKGSTVTTAELIRNACQWVYGDNERLREVFKRTRELKSFRSPFKKKKLK